MFRTFSAITASTVLALAALAALPLKADKPQRISEWWDPNLKVRFPAKLAGLEIDSRKTYGRGDLDYSIHYDPDKDGEQAVDGETFDIYIYTHPGRATTFKGYSEEVDEVMQTFTRVVSPDGQASVFVDSNRFMRVWAESGLTNAVGLCELSGFGGEYASICSVTSIGDRFVKIRYSLPVESGEDVPARRFGEVCCALDALFAASVRRAEIDVYSAQDADRTLALLRSKWPEAYERESQWMMPGCAEKVERLFALQKWCLEDFANRVSQFERICREGIETKAIPAHWYYNLACALSVQKRIEDAIEALEQAVAAGFANAGHASKDDDFANIRNDPRFGKLLEAMKASAAEEPAGGLVPLKPKGGECIVGDDNVAYDFFTKSYMAKIDTSDKKMVVYVNKNDNPGAVPCEGLTVMSFDEEAYDADALGATADIRFSYDPVGNGGELWCPTLISCAAPCEGASSSIPAMLAANGADANVEMSHEQWNVLGIYSAGDFGDDGNDPFFCWCPSIIAHRGGEEEGARFVKLAAEIIKELPFAVIEKGLPVPQVVQKIVRASQKGVDGEKGFMSGRAMRPVIDFADIDTARALAAAKAVDPGRLQPFAPYFVTVESAFPETIIGDCEDEIPSSVSAHHAGLVAVWAERTAVIDVKAAVVEDDCILEWKVLSGDAGKVRFESLSNGVMRICVDYHKVFDEVFPSGRKLRSGRVDIGCFAVRGEIASMPCVLSVYFPPTETREYSLVGRLMSVDYIKAGYTGQLPDVCPRGDWRDEFHYDENGEMTGWTRCRPLRGGGEEKDEFTADGVVVMTRDEKNRPKRCRRDLRSLWRQMLPSNADEEAVMQKYAELSAHYDTLEAQPCGDMATTLVWEYEYGEDGIGDPHPVAPVKFRCRPELCPYADFGGESGIGLPIVVQLRLGYGIYSQYKSGRTPSKPESPAKLKFAKVPKLDPSVWPVDVEGFENAVADPLRELGDGVYRATSYERKGGTEKFFSVEWTYMTINRAAEFLAFAHIDTKYSRCGTDEVMAALSSRTNEIDLAKLHVNFDSRSLMPEDLPEGKSLSCAMWEISPTMRFGVIADYGDRFESRKYFFAVVGGDRGEALTWDWFEEMPSRAIAETVLAAARREPWAVNNLAVLMYAGICSPGRASRSEVERLLESAAEKGCAEAAANLKALQGASRQ